MNVMILDRVVELDRSILPRDFVLPKKATRDCAPLSAQIDIPRVNFSYADLCYDQQMMSVNNRVEAMLALAVLKNECNLILEQKSIFNIILDRTFRVDEFKQQQNSSKTNCRQALNTTWCRNIERLIRAKFNGAMGWPNLDEATLEGYEFSKLRRFLVEVRLMMQDTIYALTYKSMNDFVRAMTLNVPLKVEVESCVSVLNTFDKLPGAEDPCPLFEIEIMIDENQDFAFTWDSEKVVVIISEVFAEGVKVTQDIEQLDKRLLKKVYKNRVSATMKLKSPELPTSEPQEPDTKSLARGRLADPNAWLWYLHKELESKMKEAIAPLNIFLKTFDKWKKEIALNPQDWVQNEVDSKFGKGEIDVNNIKRFIDIHVKKQTEILETIPDNIIVGFFRVETSSIRKEFADKHSLIIDMLQLRISEFATKTRIEIMAQFTDIRDKLKVDDKYPANIDELVDLRK